MGSEMSTMRGEPVYTALPEEAAKSPVRGQRDSPEPRVHDVRPNVYVGPEGTYPRGGRGLRDRADQLLTDHTDTATLRGQGIITRNAERDYRAREIQMEDVLREDGSLRGGPSPTIESRKRKEQAAWRTNTDGTPSATPSSLTDVRTSESPCFGHAPVARVEGTTASPPSQTRPFGLRKIE